MADEIQSEHRESQKVSNQSNEVSAINQSFTSLIQEQTYPRAIKWFKNFDKNIMMPIFKKKGEHVQRISAKRLSAKNKFEIAETKKSKL